MSRRSVREYILRKRDDYLGETPGGKSRMLDEICRTVGMTRKYVIKLLSGNIEYRGRKRRGKTYDGKTLEALKKVWHEAGCPCLPYFKAQIGTWVDEYDAHVAVVPDSTKALLLRMSDRTMSRALAGEARVKPGWSRANKHSGRNGTNGIKELVPAASGEKIMACGVPPGDIQADTFALGGGISADNFFWILNCTDRKTQWLELSPAWNRGQHATLEALKRNMRRFPFRFTSMHSDNGGEILNHHVMAFLGRENSAPFVWRSRPRKSNDNAHVEEKNGSAGRQLFGEIRLDCPWLEKDLIELCEMWSDFCNFFRPCKMLVAKAKRTDGKGYRCIYDKPRTPCQRLLDEKVLSDEAKAALAGRRSKLVGVELLNRIKKKLIRIKRLQKDYNMAKHQHDTSVLGGGGPGSALRAAPSGTPAPAPSKTEGGHHPSKHWNQYFKEKQMSAQYLANQKPPSYLQGALSI